MKTILIIDDSQADQFLATQYITKLKENYNIVQAYDGEHALEYIENLNDSLALIAMDLRMSIMDGFELLEKFAEMQVTSPVAVFTVSEDARDYEKAVEAGHIDYYFRKPINEEKLKQCLHGVGD